MSSLTIERVTHQRNPEASTTTCCYIPQITTLTAPRPPHASTLNTSTSNPFEDGGVDQIETATTNQSSTETSRNFEAGDILRVMDFDNLPDPPSNATLLISIKDFQGNEDGMFPERYVILRGSYLFFFDCQNGRLLEESTSADGSTKTKIIPPNILQTLTPLGCIPLARTKIDFPEGGRRVFREHAHTPAKNGYEFVISHTGDEPNKQRSFVEDDSENTTTTKSNIRPSVFVVVDTLGQREEWANAIRLRAEIRKRDTGLRPGGAVPTLTSLDGSGGHNGSRGPDNATLERKASSSKILKKDANLSRRMELDQMMKSSDILGTATPLSSLVSSAKENSGSSVTEPYLKDALNRFGIEHFDEKGWVYKFYEQNNEFDAPKQCRKLEEYQMAVKQGLRGAVLEQYEYFVEASREMTIMGKEVNALRKLVEGQVRMIDQLKGIEFVDLFRYGQDGGNYPDSDDSSEEDNNYRSLRNVMSREDEDHEEEEEDDEGASLSSDESSTESDDRWGSRNGSHRDNASQQRRASQSSARSAFGGTIGSAAEGNGAEPNDQPSLDDMNNAFEIPSWLDGVTEDISAFIKECRYSKATDLILKAKTELADISSQHEKLTDRRLSKKQLNTIHNTNESITDLTKRMTGRLTEALRRKNEAFRQLSKRERADPLSELAPLLSPICLNDDDTSLQLLVRLGYTNDAAEAYAARRSLLLMESLNERPISSEGRLDVVINAAQLSQSFFSCLSQAVEGFLDLFLMSSGVGMGGSHPASSTMNGKYGLDDTSIQSNPNRRVPPGALASVVLWCDSELIKFASTFGGGKILGQLELYPALNGMEHHSNSSSAFNLRSPEELGDIAEAENLKKKLATTEEDPISKSEDSRREKERKKSINIAAQCIDQAFQFASENLDSIGLPLTPRLADCLRVKLRGCEGDIAKLLQERWSHFVFDWFAAPSSNMEDTASVGSSQWRRPPKTTTSIMSPDEM